MKRRLAVGEQQVETLRYAVRMRAISKYSGQLCIVLGILSLVPCGISVLFGEHRLTLAYFLAALGLSVFGLFLSRIKAPSLIQPNEALVITAFIFFFSALIWAVPMTMSGLSFMDAFFEAVSGITTTGLSTLQTVEGLSFTFLFVRSWLQWIGGLGIVVLTVAILTGPGVTARHLVNIEESEDIVGSTRLYTRTVLKVYGAMTVLGFLLLLSLRLDWFSAITYTFSAVSTGGFAIHDSSLAALPSWHVRAAILFLSLCGALSLAFYYRAYRQGWRTIIEDLQIRYLVFFTIAVTFLLGISMHVLTGLSLKETVSNAPLMAATAQTTAGFSTLNVEGLDRASKLILITSMAIGGGLGSTAGGIKIIRILILFSMLKLLVKRTGMPLHAVTQTTVGKNRLADEEIQRVLLIIILFISVIAVSWLPFLAAGFDPLDSLFEVVSAIGTVGLSTGISSLDLPTFLKGVLCIDMLMGRVEILAYLVFFYPGTWIGRRIKIS